ncbi:hypothetical protein D9758_012589 [Tetrapyrgos nigripes]|uniref:Uncharacterized protein n=1 Tax=Tetrapyrgos nigripes TaxID=182062 RepID=A0A8H5FLT5_9AGAR|nr:hypothetical protein D9758_012589 [Tetrapyrgos nigripes]
MDTEEIDLSDVNVHKVLGSLLIAAWVNLMLYVLVIHQTIHYFRKYPNDRWLAKISVSGAVLCNTLSTMAACVNCYLFAVTRQGMPSRIRIKLMGAIECSNALFKPIQERGFRYECENGKPTAVYLASSGISGAIVQVFMLRRYWVLTRRKFAIGAIGFLIIIYLGSVGYVTSGIIFFRHNSSRNGMTACIMIWLTSGIVVDMSIAVLMARYYRSTDVDLRSSRRLIRRLATLALKTGAFSAITAMLALANYAGDFYSNGMFNFSSRREPEVFAGSSNIKINTMLTNASQ